jgi:hydroxymethylbilane synthase
MSTTLIIGSRGSQLALWQARHIASRLQELGLQTRLEIIRTTGDKITAVPLAQVGAKGLFTKEIEEALLDGRIDLAVHSLKDLPTLLPTGLVVAAIPERELAFDALVGSKLADLKPGARVGTSSLRRAAQLRRLRPDLVIEDIRGNLDTRLRKLDEGLYDVIVLAAAGLRRLGWAHRIAELLTPEQVCPAAGQGALAIETRSESEAYAICLQLNHEPTRIAVTAERALLEALGGGCQVPIGAYAEVADGRLRLRAVVVHPDGSAATLQTAEDSVENAVLCGKNTARMLLEHGGRAILRAVYGATLPLAGRRVVVTRAAEQSAGLAEPLRRMGAEVIDLPTIAFVPPENWNALDAALAGLEYYDWLVFTSGNGVKFFFQRIDETGVVLSKLRAKVCAVGPATADEAARRGLKVDYLPPDFNAGALAEALSQQDLAGKRVLLAQAAAARDTVRDALRQAGATVDAITVYRTVVPDALAEQARALFAAGPPDWVTFTSGSTVRNLLAAAGADSLAGVRCASIGPATTAVAGQCGLRIDAQAEPSTADGLAEAIARAELR